MATYFNCNKPLSNNIWDQHDYPWGEDLGRDLLKQEYDKRLHTEQSNDALNLPVLRGQQPSSEMLVKLEKHYGQQQSQAVKKPLNSLKVMLAITE